MKTFYKVYFKDFNVWMRVFYADLTLADWQSIRLNNEIITKDWKQFEWNSISFVEQIPDYEESEEKSLAYARSLGNEVFNQTILRQQKNKAPWPITYIEKRSKQNLSLTNQPNGNALESKTN